MVLPVCLQLHFRRLYGLHDEGGAARLHSCLCKGLQGTLHVLTCHLCHGKCSCCSMTACMAGWMATSLVTLAAAHCSSFCTPGPSQSVLCFLPCSARKPARCRGFLCNDCNAFICQRCDGTRCEHNHCNSHKSLSVQVSTPTVAQQGAPGAGDEKNLYIDGSPIKVFSAM